MLGICPKDVVVLVSYLVAATLNGVLFLQIVLYGEGKRPVVAGKKKN